MAASTAPSGQGSSAPNSVESIFESMEYGPNPEAPSAAQVRKNVYYSPIYSSLR